jgi:hypothetical protein
LRISRILFSMQDTIMADILLHEGTKFWVQRFHEHDSLLEHVQGEELTTEERDEAWQLHINRQSLTDMQLELAQQNQRAIAALSSAGGRASYSAAMTQYELLRQQQLYSLQAQISARAAKPHIFDRDKPAKKPHIFDRDKPAKPHIFDRNRLSSDREAILRQEQASSMSSLPSAMGAPMYAGYDYPGNYPMPVPTDYAAQLHNSQMYPPGYPAYAAYYGAGPGAGAGAGSGAGAGAGAGPRAGMGNDLRVS